MHYIEFAPCNDIILNYARNWKNRIVTFFLSRVDFEYFCYKTEVIKLQHYKIG